MENLKNILWEKNDSIGVLSINNPPENFIQEPEFIDLDFFKKITFDNTLKGIILCGTGRHFSAGADLNELKKLARDEKLLEKKLFNGKQIIQFIDSLNIPVVAGISGVCFGAGLELALACHIRICSEKAIFAFPEVNHGIMPGMGGTVMLSKLIGQGRSAEIILGGETVNDGKAMEIGLVDYMVPSKEVINFATDFLKRITYDRDIHVIKSIMKSIHNSLNMSFEQALIEETKLFCGLAIRSLQDQK
jgi:enoyl-CoA hydratase